MGRPKPTEEALLAKIRCLPPERVDEVEDFVDFLRLRDEGRRLTQATSRGRATADQEARVSRFRTEATVPAPLNAVWDLMVQADRMPEWNTELDAVLDVTGDVDRVGGGYRQVWRMFGRRIESKHPWQVVAVEPYRAREFRGILPIGVGATGRDRFDAVDGGTRVTVEIEYERPWGTFGRLLERMMRAMLRRTMAANARALTALLQREGVIP